MQIFTLIDDFQKSLDCSSLNCRIRFSLPAVIVQIYYPIIILHISAVHTINNRLNGIFQRIIISNFCRSLQRAFCLVCGKVPKQPNATPFYEVETATLPTANAENNFTSLAKKLREVIKISDSQRNQLVPSKEVCKKCFRSLVDMEFMENQVIWIAIYVF